MSDEPATTPWVDRDGVEGLAKLDPHREVAPCIICHQRCAMLVDDVRMGHRLTRDGEVMDTTPGAFVVVDVTVAATGTSELLYSDSRLVTRGLRVYDEFGLQSSRAAPGFSERTEYVFEVDPGQIEDLTLELWRLEIINGFQARVQVHLGITPGNADQWRDAATGRSVEVDTNATTRGLG